jgi:N-acyl-L-homoserine lactone synthetase
MIENGRFGVSYKIENKRKKNIVTYVIAFDLFQILTYWALQNDSQNLSFVKAINLVGKKMARNTYNMANS